MICFLFAVPEEASGLIYRMKQVENFEVAGLRCFMGDLEERIVLVALIGMGLENARDRTEVLFQYFRLRCVIHAGFGGSLVPSLKRGQILMSDNYSSDNLLSFARIIDEVDFAHFSSRDRLVGRAEDRAALAEETGCQVVDMESAPVAHIVAERDIQYAAIRIISDDFEDKIPLRALEIAYDRKNDRARGLALSAYLATHPWHIPSLFRFVSRIPGLRRRLTNFLMRLIGEFPRNW